MVLLALALLWPAPAAADPVDVSVVIDVLRGEGVRFHGHRLPRRGEGMGVATLVDEIATAAHVVWGASKITVTDAQGEQRSATIKRLDRDADIALLHIDRRLPYFATIRLQAPVRGERVGTVHHLPRFTVIAADTVWDTRWRSHGVAVPLILTGIKGRKGMSGGGLFDQAGRLVGIIIRIDRRLGYLSALPVAELCRRLSRCAGPADDLE